MLSIIQNGPDYTSLLGSNLAENSLFYFISANGYNIFNGIVFVYYKNLKNKNILTHLHSVIDVPETFNTNFGLIASANDDYLAIGGISFNKYNGAIFLYKFRHNNWIYFQRLQDACNLYEPILGFGIHILLTNNSRLIVSNFDNEIYIFEPYDYKDYFVQTKKLNITLSHTNNDYRFLVSDNYNNIIASYLTGELYVISIADEGEIINISSGYNITAIDTCFYGSYLLVEGHNLFVSCSLYYPFYSVPNIVQNYVFVYSLSYGEKNQIKDIDLLSTITPPGNDTFFATNMALYEDNLLIVGTNTVYHYKNNDSNHLWNLYDQYYLPYSSVNYDYKVKIYGKYFIVGNYGFNDLQGALFIGDTLKPVINPIINPDNPDNPDTLNTNMIKSINSRAQKMGMILIILLLGIITFIFVIVTIHICFFQTYLISDKKKKKNEEDELSPYKIYSYVGYTENDYAPITYPQQIYFTNPHYSYLYPPSVVSPPITNYSIPLDKVDKVDKPGVEYINKESATYISLKKKYEAEVKPLVEEIKRKREKERIFHLS